MCSGYGGGLASISNEKEMDFVRKLSSKLTSDPVWIGLAYRFQKRAYLWSNGSSFNSSVSGKWLGKLARNVSENKCVEILGNGPSLTDCCKENKYFICEKAKGELPQKKFIWQRCSSNILHVYEKGEGKVVDWASFRGPQSKITDIRVVELSVTCIESVNKSEPFSLVQKNSQQLSRN